MCANLCDRSGGGFLEIFVAPPGALVAATAALHVRTELHRAEVQSMRTVKRRLTSGNQSAVLQHVHLWFGGHGAQCETVQCEQCSMNSAA